MRRSKKNGKTSGHFPSVHPRFMAQGANQTSWGGDGTVVAPDSVRVSLPFEQILEPNATVGSLYSYQYRGNSVFDPDYTGVGAQPTGFDQWAAFYNEYTVISSQLEVECICATSAGVEYVTYPSYNASIPASTVDGSSRPYAKRALLIGSGSGVRQMLRSNMSTAQMMGVREEAVLDDDQYGATVSGNPGAAAVWYWTVLAQNQSNTSTLVDAVRVRIVYDVLFHDRVQLSLSSTRNPRLKSDSLPAGGRGRNNGVDCQSAASAAASGENTTNSAPDLCAVLDNVRALLAQLAPSSGLGH